MPLQSFSGACDYARPGVPSWTSWDGIARPVMQVIGKQAVVDILDLSKVAWTCSGCFCPGSGLGLGKVKELDL